MHPKSSRSRRGDGKLTKTFALSLLMLAIFCGVYFKDSNAFEVSASSPSEVALTKEIVGLRTTMANMNHKMDEVTTKIEDMKVQLDELGSSTRTRRDDTPVLAVNQADSPTTTSPFRELYARLFGPDEYGGGCHPTCGCPNTPKDCPRWYKIPDLLQTIALHSQPNSRKEMAKMLKASKKKAWDVCSKLENEVQKEVGGWCLKPDPSRLGLEDVKYQNKSHPMATGHVEASERIVIELEDMIKNEGISSINDFGAGIGQYKAAILPKFPSGLTYSAYDGAGNVENYTQGLVDYFDLTVPLDLPVSDWVISLEVGEHVPSKFEGMVIRNLHRHNRKGIILSWAKLGQDGTAHVNNHSPQYVQSLFRELGYVMDATLSEKFQQRAGNYWFFSQGSLAVFRRHKPKS